jgi:hypothetical protein
MKRDHDPSLTERDFEAVVSLQVWMARRAALPISRSTHQYHHRIEKCVKTQRLELLP